MLEIYLNNGGIMDYENFIDVEKVEEAILKDNIIADIKERKVNTIKRKFLNIISYIKDTFNCRNIRYARVADKWNSEGWRRAHWFDNCVDKEKGFKWGHLIWQEISMWVSENKQVTPEDFKFIVERRGFDYDMANYLLELVKYSGLGGRLEEIELLSRAIIYIPSKEKEEKL
jgi:hypothetical protein